MNRNVGLRSYLPALALGVTASLFGVGTLAAQMPADCPLHAQHTQAAATAASSDQQGTPGAHEASTALDQVDARGDQVMGFSHRTATHHFLLTGTGGAIEVAANDTGDAATRDQVRTHLQKVASDFRAGDFSMPSAVHGGLPTGAETMRAKGPAIDYRYGETPLGGRVELIAGEAEAVAAIHAFLRFQIVEHRTGDSLEPGRP